MKLLLGSTVLLFLCIASVWIADPKAEDRRAGAVTVPCVAVDQTPKKFESLGGLVDPIDVSAAEFQVSVAERLRAVSEPHGHHACATGCALSHHPTERLSADHCADLLRDYQNSAAEHASEALESLIYFGAQTSRQLLYDSHRRLLDTQHLEFLNRELSRKRAIVSIRVVDEGQQIRANLPPTTVPQHVRQVFTLDAQNLQSLVCSGTVKRVGLNHAWQRL